MNMELQRNVLADAEREIETLDKELSARASVAERWYSVFAVVTQLRFLLKLEPYPISITPAELQTNRSRRGHTKRRSHTPKDEVPF